MLNARMSRKPPRNNSGPRSYWMAPVKEGRFGFAESQEKDQEMSFREASPVSAETAPEQGSSSAQSFEKTFLEFFAGGGMARAGLGDGWRCLFANDIDSMKAKTYCNNWGSDHFTLKDVADVRAPEIAGHPDLAWASFPCQDLSLAGWYNGLSGERSGMFWAFWNVIEGLKKDNRAPQIIVLENVYGALTANQSNDFCAIGDAIAKLGYRFGALVIDARHFVPQSRQRLFWIAIQDKAAIPENLVSPHPVDAWSPKALIQAHEKLSAVVQKKWVWWNLPKPPAMTEKFVDYIEDEPAGVEWHTEAETNKLLALMDDVNRRKVEKAIASGKKMVGGVYRRTRPDKNGNKVQRAEVRFDDLSGCLRTPSGGSSRQTILVVDNNSVRSRLLSGREAACLMGLNKNYKLPKRYNDAYHVAGDGVVVPVVRHLAQYIFEPLIHLVHGS